MKIHLLFIALVAFATPHFAQRDLKNIPNPDPEEERKTFIVPEGFEVSLYAADPLAVKPIEYARFHVQLAVDCIERGLSTDQARPESDRQNPRHRRQRQERRRRNDERLCRWIADSDRRNSGRQGGCYVANSTELLHFSRENLTDTPRLRKLVLSGFGTENTDHLLHTRLGPRWLPLHEPVDLHSLAHRNALWREATERRHLAIPAGDDGARSSRLRLR